MFTKIEVNSYKTAIMCLGDRKDDVSADISNVCQAVISFGDTVNKFIDSFFAKWNGNSKFIFPNRRLQEHMIGISDEIDKKTNNIVRCLRELYSAPSEELFYELCLEEGELALIIRFELLSSPVEVAGESSFENVYNQLKEIGIENNDYYQVAKRWQNTMRRFLPEIHIHDTAIVVQGPILYEDDFTLETLYRYRKIYPETTIVLSTWEGEVSDEFSFLATSINVLILENATPDETGPSNIKYQLKSSYEGIRLAKEDENIKYVMKTRTDQRIIKPDFLPYFKNLLRTYSCNKQELSERIVFLGGWNSMSTFPFRISDFLTFGCISDLFKLYSASGDYEKFRKTYEIEGALSKHISKWASRIMFENSDTAFNMSDEDRRILGKELYGSHDPESYLGCDFYERVILKRQLNEDDDILMHYWQFLKKYVVIVDADQLLLFWHKYQFMNQEWNSLESDGGLTYSMWLSLYYDLEELNMV
jgi:hypothetical protein